MAKRYEINNTTSINNIKTVYNELVKSMDGLGYTNLLRNNYFKTKLKNNDTDNNTIISKWRDYTTSPEADYNGTPIEESTGDFVYLTSTSNENIFGLKANTKIYQEITFNDLERLSHTGVLNLKLFFVKDSLDSADATIELEYYDGTWNNATNYVIDSSESNIIAGEFTDETSPLFYSGGDNFVFVQQSISYNLLDDSVFRYIDSTNEVLFRVVIENPSGATDYKYLMNAVAYFGNSDASSFVKNIDDNSGNVEYDETKGEYKITNDGQDDVYLSVNKYFITVGSRGTYTTIAEAITSIGDDETNWGNERIIYLTSDITLDADATLLSGTRILGNGNTINCNSYKIDIDGVTDITLENLTITDDDATATQILYVNNSRNINFKNIDFSYTGTTHNTTIPYIYINSSTISEYINFYNCSLDTNKYVKIPIKFEKVQFSYIHFNEIIDFGDYNSGASTWTGYGVYMIGDATTYCKYNTIKIGLLQSQDSSTYDTLYGVYLSDYCTYNEVHIIDYDESNSS